MKPLTKQWLRKAEQDFRVMRREMKASEEITEEPAFDAICFHAQQCAEKLIKGFLVENDVSFPKIHDIRELLLIVKPIRPEWENMTLDAAFLSRYASRFRYPSDFAYKEEAELAIAACERIRKVVLQAFKDIDQLRLNP